jgi:hypothetical protein
MRQRRLYSVFFRHDQKSHAELVQHAAVRQSDESGGALPEKSEQGKFLSVRKWRNYKTENRYVDEHFA